MSFVTFLAICFLGGFLLFVLVAVTSARATNKTLAKEMLRGVMHHEIKALLKLLQKINQVEVDKIFTPLTYLCNLVCLYVRLDGSFYDLNDKIETIRATLASQDFPVPTIKFLYAGYDHQALVEVGTLGRKYIFDLHHTDSLEIMEVGSGIK